MNVVYKNYVLIFGKYKGKKVEDVPKKYYSWACWTLSKEEIEEEKRRHREFRGDRFGWENSSIRRDD